MKIGIIGAGAVGAACAMATLMRGFASESRFGVTLSLPGVVGRQGCLQVLDPRLSDDERVGLEKSIETLRKAQDRIH
jgi:malate/lactate dehydrogenase